MKKHNSPYSASFTAASMMYNETLVVVQMLLNDDLNEVKKKLKEDAEYLKIQSVSARERVMAELTKRYETMPKTFWIDFMPLPEEQQRLALFFVLLKTYRLLFHFQVELALPKYNSIDRVLCSNDVIMCLNEIASKEEFVNGWSEQTRKKISSTYITMLKQAGLIDKTNGELMPPALSDEDLVRYAQSGDVWFLQACFLPQYRIEQIKMIAI